MIDKIKNIINPENKDVCSMSSDELIELLTKLNRCLRCLDDNEDVRWEKMMVNDTISPTKDIKEKILDYLMTNIKKIPDNKQRAAAVYYTLLDLHMFSDGNGRTSRFMYDLISGELDEGDISYYFHQDSELVKNENRELETNKGIADIYFVNQIPDLILKDELTFIPKKLINETPWITAGAFDYDIKTVMPPAVANELSEEEIDDLNWMMQDGSGVNLTPSGVSMLYVIQKKGELEKWAKYNEEFIEKVPGRFVIAMRKHPEGLSNWDANDFREVIKAGKIIKFWRIRCIIDIFIYPDKFINPKTGNTFLHDILNNSISEDIAESITV